MRRIVIFFITLHKFGVIDEALDEFSTMSTASIADKLVSELGDIAELTFEKIDVAEVSSRVKSDQAGAVVVFEGTTRDTFQRGRSLMNATHNRR